MRAGSALAVHQRAQLCSIRGLLLALGLILVFLSTRVVFSVDFFVWCQSQCGTGA